MQASPLRNLKLTGQFNNIKVELISTLRLCNAGFHFLDIKEQTLNGESNDYGR